MTAIKAHFDGRVLVPDEPLDLPLNETLEIIVYPRSETNRPLLELAKKLSQLPHRADAPVDGAAQHDDYLYGLPKRP